MGGDAQFIVLSAEPTPHPADDDLKAGPARAPAGRPYVQSLDWPTRGPDDSRSDQDAHGCLMRAATGRKLERQMQVDIVAYCEQERFR